MEGETLAMSTAVMERRMLCGGGSTKIIHVENPTRRSNVTVDVDY
jgi:hypothetical protein